MTSTPPTASAGIGPAAVAVVAQDAIKAFLPALDNYLGALNQNGSIENAIAATEAFKVNIAANLPMFSSDGIEDLASLAKGVVDKYASDELANLHAQQTAAAAQAAAPTTTQAAVAAVLSDPDALKQLKAALGL